jgi:D-alanine-D-alanine ligase
MIPVSTAVELALTPFPPDQWLIFNLYESLAGRLFEEARNAWGLEAMGYRFTGSGGEAIARTTNKAYAKSIMTMNGIPTPPWWLFRDPDDAKSVQLDDFHFPLIIKPVAEDASTGVTEKAIAHATSELQERVAYVIDRYRQAALVE